MSDILRLLCTTLWLYKSELVFQADLLWRGIERR